jgi:hypothetical protein
MTTEDIVTATDGPRSITGPNVRVLTQAELMAEAKAAFGDDWLDWAFRCPSCDDVASFRDFKVAGGEAALCGQECIGRTLGANSPESDYRDGKWTGRGCDWAAYGLFAGPWQIILPAEEDKPERKVWSFPLAVTK